MIGIKIGDSLLDVSKDTKISLSLVNPLFNENNLSPGSLSFPFDLPSGDDSPHNAVLLGQPDVIENTERFRKVNASLNFDGLPLKIGKLVVRGGRGNKTTANFNFGLNSLSDEIKTKKLREIIAETIVIDNTPITKKIYLKPGTAGAAPYRININNETYENNTLSGLADDINAAGGINRATDTSGKFASATYVASGSPSPLGYITGPYLLITPFLNPTDPHSPLHVDVTEDNGNAGGGYKWIAEADLGAYYAGFNTFLNSYLTTTPATDKFRFPFLFNLKSQAEQFAGLGNHYVNAAVNTTILPNNPNVGIAQNIGLVTYSPNSIQPFLRVRWIFDKIAEYFNWQYEGDWLDEATTLSMLVDNTNLLDLPQNFLGTSKFNFWKRSFNLQDLVPDITAVDFIKAYQGRYNLGVYLNEKTGRVRIVKKEVIALSTASDDITSLCSKSNGNDDISVAGFRLTTEAQAYDSQSLPDDFVIDQGEDPIKVSLAPLQRDQEINDDFGRNYIGPIVAQKQDDKFTLRVFHYKGIVNNGTFTYAAASVDAATFREKFASLTELFITTPGVYEKFWKYWLHFAARRRVVKFPVQFEYRHLNRLDWELKKRIANNNYLIKQIDVDITNRGLSVSNVELYTMV